MKRKKVIALIMSAALAVCIIGGTLAYFSSQDTAENKFTTIGDNTNGDSDIKIVENFPDPGDVTPGDEDIKAVQVQNVDKYPQLIRVHFEVNFLEKDANGNLVVKTGADGKPVTSIENMGKTIKASDLQNNLIPGIVNLYQGAADLGKWYEVKDASGLDINATYYYLNAVPGGSYTSKILDTVTLKLGAGNEYQNIAYEVKVVADGVQSANAAYKDAWSPDSTLDGLLDAASKAELDTPIDPAIKAAQNK